MYHTVPQSLINTEKISPSAKWFYLCLLIQANGDEIFIVAAKDLSESYHLSPAYIENELLILAREGFLTYHIRGEIGTTERSFSILIPENHDTHPIAESKFTCFKEIDGWVQKYLGLPNYSCEKDSYWYDENFFVEDVDLSEYDEERREKVKRFLNDPESYRCGVDWLLCEIAERAPHEVSQGRYIIER